MLTQTEIDVFAESLICHPHKTLAMKLFYDHTEPKPEAPIDKFFSSSVQFIEEARRRGCLLKNASVFLPAMEEQLRCIDEDLKNVKAIQYDREPIHSGKTRSEYLAWILDQKDEIQKWMKILQRAAEMQN